MLVPINSLESATLTVWVNTGSKKEDFKKMGGISHFLEHMVFKGSKKRPTAKAISQAVDGIGGEFNAGTNKEYTNFYIRARSKHLEQAFDVLSDMVLNPILDEKEIEREKGVILEEMAMYDDTPMYKIGDVFENLIFEENTLGNDIIGTKETIKKMTKNDFLVYRKSHYYTENILLTVAGNIDEKSVIKLSEKYFGNVAKTPLSSLKKLSIKINQDNPKVKLLSKKNEQAHLIMGFVGNKRMDESRFVEAITSTILGGGMSSRMFTEVRERRGLCYSIRTDSEHYVETGYLSTYAGVETSKVDEAIKVILDQYMGISTQKYKVTTEELIKAKEYLKGHIALALEDTRKISSFFGESELLLGKHESVNDIYKGIDKVTIDEIYEFSKDMFKLNKLNLAIIGPYKDSQRFEKLVK